LWPRSCDLFCNFGTPPLYMRQKAEATSFKFDTQIDYKEYTFEMVVSKS